MPSTMFTIERLLEDGPCIPVQIAWPSRLSDHLRARGLPVPEPVVTLAILDTVHLGSRIGHVVVDKLDLKAIPREALADYGWPEDLATFMVRIVALVGVADPPVAPLEPFPVHVFQQKDLRGCMLGRNFLRHCSMNYIGWDNSFSISIDPDRFPS